MTLLLYQTDSYLREFEAKVIGIEGDTVFLDRTAFNPRSGGLVSDTGFLVKGSKRVRVKEVYINKETGDVAHLVEDPSLFSEGDIIKGVIDWDRRYRIMRMHTGIHVLINVFNKKTGALVTGNQVAPERSRVDLNLPKPDKELVLKVFEEANNLLREERDVIIYYLEREKALKIPGIVKLAKAMPPQLKKLRIVEIAGIDIQADGGPHVRNTREVGELIFLKMENKGRNNRRIYFTINP